MCVRISFDIVEKVKNFSVGISLKESPQIFKNFVQTSNIHLFPSRNRAYGKFGSAKKNHVNLIITQLYIALLCGMYY